MASAFFAFVYPLEYFKARLHRVNLATDPWGFVHLLGGFAYFDGAGKLLVINEIVGTAGQSGNSNRRGFGSVVFSGVLIARFGGARFFEYHVQLMGEVAAGPTLIGMSVAFITLETHLASLHARI